MMPSLPCFADVGGVSLQDFIPKHMMDPEYIIIVGCLLAVSLLVFIWAAFFRKPGSHHHRAHHHSHRHRPVAATADDKAEGGRRGWFFSGKHHHRHRHRRRERPRNPTLAEAGGLPPIRATDPPRGPI